MRVPSLIGMMIEVPRGALTCEQIAESPFLGRFDWNWVGLGWTRPDEMRRRRERHRPPDEAPKHAA